MKTNLIKIALNIFLVLFFNSLYAQTNSYGHADNFLVRQYHVSFQTGSPQVVHSNLNSNTGDDQNYGVFSDQNGNLKLYSNGKSSIWKGNYQYLNNGFELDTIPQREPDDNIMIPMPGNPDIIYLFTMSDYPPLNPPNSSQHMGPDTLFYSLIDISGQGNVIVNKQPFTNHQLCNGFGITKHTNGRDYWLVTRKHNQNKYLTFRIKPGGNVDTISSVAGIQPHYTYAKDHSENILLSPDGRRLADSGIRDDTMQLLNFNALTGKVHDSDMVVLTSSFTGVYPSSMAFSADNSKLYTVGKEVWSYYYPTYYQYDLSAGGQQAIKNSRTMIFDAFNYSSGITSSHGSDDLFLAPNHKIYSTFAPNPSWINGDYFHLIDKPNLAGNACQFQPQAFVLDSTNPDYLGRFPEFPSSWLQEPVDISHTHTCAGENAQATHFALTDSVYQVTWHFSDSATAGPDTSTLFHPSHKYLQPGQYTVWVKALHYGMWDSVAKTITIYPNPQISLGQDTMLTGNDTLVLDPGGGYASYLWNTGDTTQTLMLYGSQMSGGSHTYWVEVTDTNGCSAKAYRTIVYSGVGIHEQNSDKWKVYPNPAGESLTIELPRAMQAEAVLKLYNQSGAMVRNTEWPAQQQKYQLSLSGLSEGIYWLELDDGEQVLRRKVMKQ